MGKHKHGKKKVILNNVDVPLSKVQAKVIKSTNVASSAPSEAPKSILKPTDQPQAKPKPSTAPSSVYELPELFSTLTVSKQMETVMKTKPPTVNDFVQLTPSTKNQLIKEISKTLNHQPGMPVFTKLSPVVQSDPVDAARPTESRPKPQALAKKNPELTIALQDYLMPIEPLEYKYVPKIPKMAMPKMLDEDNFENIKYVKSIIDGDQLQCAT